MQEPLLPEPFADLCPHVAEWALPTEKERFAKRIASRLDEVTAFNDALYARIDAVIQYLNTQPLHATDAPVVRLMNLARAYMETSHPVDLKWKTTDLADAFPSERFEFLEPSC